MRTMWRSFSSSVDFTLGFSPTGAVAPPPQPNAAATAAVKSRWLVIGVVRPHRPPDALIDAVRHELHRAVAHADVHAARVIAARGCRDVENQLRFGGAAAVSAIPFVRRHEVLV